MINFLKHFFLGVALGLALLFFFIGYEANAMVISNTGLDVRDSDIIGTTIDASNPYETIVKIQYIDEWKDTIGLDEIGENYEKVGNTYKIYTGKAYHRDMDLWFMVDYATTTLVEFQKATEEPEIIGLLKYIIPIANAQDSFYSDNGDGHTNLQNSNWDTLHDATDASSISDTLCTAQSSKPTTNYQITRCFLPFDTNIIDDDNTIASGSVFLYDTNNYLDNDNDGKDHVGLYDSIQDDPETLATNQYNDLRVDNPYLMSNTIDLTGIGINQWHRFTLNATGTNNVDAEGWTLFSLREGHDALDELFAGSSGQYNSAQFYTSEESGKEPYLLVDTEEPAEATSTPTATTTTISVPCDLVPNNELSMAVWCVEEWGDSTTSPEKTYYGYAHIPFIVWIIIAIPTLWLASRLLLEFIIRLRRY